MEPSVAEYRLDSEGIVREVTEALREAFPSSPTRRVPRRMTYLDTFDWRLLASGSRLALARDDGSAHLLWKPEGDDGLYRCPVARPPEFHWELPEGVLRRQITPLIEVRRLFPVVEVEVEGSEWSVLDPLDKIVVRLMIERGTAIEPEAREGQRKIRASLRVVPVKGYPDAFDEVRSFIEQRIELPADSSSLLTRALEALGRDPSRLGSKPVYPIAPQMRADRAMKAIYRVLLGAMLRNESGVRGNLDTEFLHDFRVAGRRTRSGLTQVPGVFPKTVVRRTRQGLSWLGGFTGPVRDLDVFLLTMPRYGQWLPGSLADGLSRVEASLHTQHRRAHRRLVAALDRSRYRRLIAAWREYLDEDVPSRTTLPNAARPIIEVASERIRVAHRRVIKKGLAIDDSSPPELLHRLRIECKKLRYLLEFFSGLYPPKRTNRLIAALKKLQNNLGDYNDLAVQRGMLTGIAGQEGQAGMAIAVLLRHIDQRQLETREAFQARFDSFASPKVERLFDRVLQGPAA